MGLRCLPIQNIMGFGDFQASLPSTGSRPQGDTQVPKGGKALAGPGCWHRSTSMSHGVPMPLPCFLCLAPWLCCRVLQWSLPHSSFWDTSSTSLLISWHLLYSAPPWHNPSRFPGADALGDIALLPTAENRVQNPMLWWGVCADFGCMVLIRN